VKIFWKNPEKTILIHEFPDAWEWADYMIAMKKMRQTCLEVGHEIFLIIDARQVNLLPKGCMIYFNEGNQNTPSHVVMRILVSRKWSMRAVTSFLIKVAPHNFQNFFCASSIEDAYQLIHEAQRKPVEAIDAECA
jgi:hypothetical protein